jgi:hypothetical protein
VRIELFGVRFQFGLLTEIRKRRELPTPRKVPVPTEEASEQFWDAFQFGGTLVTTCRCGRTHFCSNTDLDYEDGELAGLLANAAIDPDKYIQNSIDSSVAVMDGPGGILVWGCLCHGAKPFENFLIDYRAPILDYYARRLKLLAEQNKREEAEFEAAL